MAETAEDSKAGWEMEEGRDDREEARAAMLGVLGDEGAIGSRGLLPGAEAAPLRDRGDSNEDTDSSAVSSDEEEVRRLRNERALPTQARVRVVRLPWCTCPRARELYRIAIP